MTDWLNPEQARKERKYYENLTEKEIENMKIKAKQINAQCLELKDTIEELKH